MSQIEYVWVFNGDRNRYPSAVFLNRSDGELWISSNRLTGTLTKYPVGVSVYDWAVRNGVFAPRSAKHTSPSFIANFSSASQEHFHFDPDEEA
jgi:hypothetical protein